MTDTDFKIVSVNPAFERVMGMKAEELIGMSISEFVPEEYFVNVLHTKTDIVGEKINIGSVGFTGLMNIMYVSDEDKLMITIQDITDSENRKAELEKLRLNTVDVAQKVIDKQMMVAQEIASLLGETTAETKVALNKLKKVVIKEGE